jgi:hypothetical protein
VLDIGHERPLTGAPRRFATAGSRRNSANDRIHIKHDSLPKGEHLKLSDAMGTLRSTSDQTHKFWAYFQAFTAAAITLAWSATSEVPVIVGLTVGYLVFSHFNRLLISSSQADARKIWEAIQEYVKQTPQDVPELLIGITKTNEPQEPERVRRLHASMTALAAVVMLARIPFLP